MFSTRHYAIYDGLLKSELPKIASRDFMEFVLHQYDQSCLIQGKRLIGADRARWLELGPIFRRAVKYLAECITLLAPGEALELEPNVVDETTQRCWIFAEQLINLAILSDQTYKLFPDDSILTINSEGELNWCDLRVKQFEKYEEFVSRVRRDKEERTHVLDDLDFFFNTERIHRLIDPAFKQSLHCSYTEVQGFATNLAESVLRLDEGFDVAFVNEDRILSSIEKGLSLQRHDAKTVLDGLVLRRDAMSIEGRVAWKPKQEYRAYSRPFFEFPHEDGTHFAWSKSMAKECLFTLFTRVAHKLVPPEWSLGDIPQALATYEQEITKRFENAVIEELRKLGVASARFKSQVGQGDRRVLIPSEIGEIDFIAYFEKQGLLVVGDAKLIRATHEPAFYRDDVDKFLSQKDYVNQVKRKAQWVQEELEKVVKGLCAESGFPSDVSVNSVAPILVTYFPAFASCFIDDVPCVCLSELSEGITDHDGWPY